MSSRPTGTSSFTHVYCCLRREPQALCSRLKEMARLASVAEKSFTGIDTSPNETVSDAIDLAAMASSPGSLFFQHAFQALLLRQGIAPAIARACQALRRVADAKVQRVRACE